MFPVSPFLRFSVSVLALAALSYPLFFHHLDRRDLWSSHEARAAQNAQTMIESGEWGLPRLYDGQVEMQKPPLYYWLVAAIGFLRDGRVDAWAVRLPAALSATLGMIGVFLLLWRTGRPLAGFLSAVILGTMLHYTWLARVGRIDMPLTVAIGGTLGCFYLALHSRQQNRLWESHCWFVASCVAMSAGILLKGPIGLVLPALVIAAHFAFCKYLVPKLCLGTHCRETPFRVADRKRSFPDRAFPNRVWERDESREKTMQNEKCKMKNAKPEGSSVLSSLAPLLCVLLVALLTLPWFLWANHQTDGEFFRVFLYRHNFQRGLGGDDALHDHDHPWWFYGPRLLADMFPWSLLLPVAGFVLLRKGVWREDAEARLGGIWFLVMLVFLSCMRFKRADYLLPAYPGAALLLGCAAERCLQFWASALPSPRAIARGVAISFTCIVAACVIGWMVYVDHVLPRSEPAREQRSFAEAVRRRVPQPGFVLLFRTEAHGLVYHLGKPFDRIWEWENLDIWACRPGPVYVIMPPECAAEWPQYLEAGQLHPVFSSSDLAGTEHEEPLVLLCTRPVDQ